MKKITLLLLGFCLSGISLTAQTTGIFKNNSPAKSKSFWYSVAAQQNIKPDAVFILHKNLFGLSDNDEMLPIKSETDQLGMTHQRFQQYYKGVAVEGNVAIVHSQNSRVISVNGMLTTGLKLQVTPALSPSQAINIAISSVNAQKYMWESPENENFIKNLRGNPNATYYPQAIPVIIDKNFSGQAQACILAYKVNVYAEKPLIKQDIYVNALSGEIYHKINMIQTGDVPGTAVTKYSGNQQITADSVSPGVYRLRETGRGNGIFTYNMQTSTNYASAVDFTDTDNYWNNVNAAQDEIATDAHFGAEKTYDYFFLKFGRDSYDDNGAALNSFVHYDQDYENAFWDGTRMTYGDGNGTQTGPFTSLDVCAHEITHAVTEHTANLIYQDEPGALNEAFSDIFAAAVEFYAVPALADWFIGEDFDLSGGNGFRNMSNPNEDDQPDTYKGLNWYTGVMDNGGVHINSGVANFWFYLLTEGGSGVNDIGNPYSVSGQGIIAAEKIAYRALSVYLTPSSQYIDARMATIQAAQDLYGFCSAEMIATANAWYAVGIGQPVADDDVYISEILSPVTDCGLDHEPVVVRMVYNGCNTPISSGTKIYFFYKADSGPVVKDSLILSANLNGGDSLIFTFSVLADVHIIGPHTINSWLSHAGDTISFNDTISGYSFVNKLYQNSDVGIVKFTSPVSECHLGTENISVEVGFFGCDLLAAGAKIPLSYKVNSGAEIFDTLTLASNFLPNQNIAFTFATPYDFSSSGTYTLSASTHFDIDSLNSNDQLNGYQVKNPYSLRDTIIRFDEANTANNFVVTEAPYANTYILSNAGNNGTKGFKMTGGNAMSYMDMLEFPNGINTWQINEFLSAKITFCVDATGWSTANMRFDMKQSFGKQAYEMFLGAGNDYSTASNLRVLVNGITQVSPTYNPITASADPFVSRFINLDGYAGTKFTVTIETRNIAKDTLMFIMDNAYIDNVKFMENSDVGLQQIDLSSMIEVFPNPVSDILSINYYASGSQHAVISVYDIQGKELLSQNSNTNHGLNTYTFNVRPLTAGVYILSLKTENGIFNTRIIKQ